MKFLLLTQYYFPEPGSAALKMRELAEFLAARGHTVSVVTGFPNYPYGRIYPGYKLRLCRREALNGVNLIRVALYPSGERRKFFKRMLNHLSFMLSAVFGGLRSGRPDLIYYYSPPLFTGFSGWILKLIFRVPLAAEINDLWPQAPIALGVIKNNFIKRAAFWFEKFVYRKTDHLFFYSRTMMRQVLDKGVPEAKTGISPLWVSTKEFSLRPPDEASALKNEFGWQEKSIVMYAGYIGMAQGLQIVIDLAKRLKTRPGIIFVLVGDGPEKERLMQTAQEAGLSNLSFVPFQETARIPCFLSAADILFATLVPAEHRKGTIPAKILAYLSMEKPLLIAAEGEAAQVALESGGGRVVRPGDIEGISRAIIELIDNSRERQEMAKKARRYVLDNFDKEKICLALEKRLIEIAGQKNKNS